MRVLLPLRKPAANKQSSNENLVALENEVEGVDFSESTLLTSVDGATLSSEGLSVFLSQGDLEASFPEQFLSGKARSESPQVSAAQQISAIAPVPRGAWKTTGLQNHEPDRKKSASSPRKRPRPTSDDFRKRPAVEQKPAAKPSFKMGLGPAGRKGAQDSFHYGASAGIGSLGRPFVTSNDPDESENPVMGGNRVTLYVNSRTSPPRPAGEPDSIFELELKKRGLEIKRQEGDGNCLFRAVSLQVYGDPSMHGEVRKQCMDFMERDKEHFSQFVTDEDFAMYIQRKRQDGVHGNNPEIQAISELFNRPIEVFSPDKGSTPLNIFHAEYKTDDEPIRLSYHDGNHYNAVVDPLVPTAGLGLGLPGLQPGLADKLQMAKAVAESDATADQMELQRALKESQDDELQRAIKESKLSTEHMRSNEAMTLSDVDATYFELEQAALEHSLQSHFHFEHGKKQSASTSQEMKRSTTTISMPPSVEVGLSASLSNVASLPTSSTNVASEARIPEVAIAAAASVSSPPSVASVASAAKSDDAPSPLRAVDEYPPLVQEMVMNGFELSKVVRAVELIGENFEDVLAFLMSTMS